MKVVPVYLFIILFSMAYSFSSRKDVVSVPKTKAELGELLFHEKLLSRDKTISCASCHQPDFAFADTLALSLGVEGRLGTRNTPSVTNLKYRPAFFYDGRASTLAEQVHFPVNNPLEMDFTISEAAMRLNKVTHYQTYFMNLYGHLPDSASIVDALVQFEQTLETSNTPFDLWMNDQPNTMSESAIRGREVFMSKKAKCFDCHFSPDFTGDEFRNIGLYDGEKLKDRGRFDHTKDSADLGKFKVPGLRNVAVTAPYMHNGMFKTLREVIDYYDDPKKIIINSINSDSLIKDPLFLTEQEKVDLEHFLEALTDERFKGKM